MTNIAKAVRDGIKSLAGVSYESIQDHTGMLDLGLDSLDMVELLMIVEDELEIEVPDEVVPFSPEGTVGEYIAKLEAYVAANPSILGARYIN